MTITAELADGRRLEFPDGTDPAVVQATVKKVLSSEGDAGASVPNTINSVGRQLGLTARAGMEGLPAIADIAWNPARQLAVNPALRAFGLPDMGSMEEAGGAMADILGLPKPANANERVVQQGAKLAAGAVGGSALAKGAANMAAGTTQAVMQALAANPGAQAAGGAGAGLAGQSAKEGGASPWGQLGASLLGAVAGGASARPAMGVVDAAEGLWRHLKGGSQAPSVDLVLEQTLAKSGIDWANLSAQAKAALREDAGKMIVKGQALDPAALRRLADFRAVPGSTPLLGDVTADPRLLSIQRNLGKQQANMPSLFGATDIAGATNQNAKAVLGSLDGASTSVADQYGTGQGLLSMVGGKDAAWAASNKAAYTAARDAAGRDIPLARGAFVQDANQRIKDTNAGGFLPEEAQKWLNTISQGEVPFTVDTIDGYKRILSNLSQKYRADGNASMAIKAIRGALDDVGIEPIKRDFGGGQVVTEAGAKHLQGQDALPAEAMKLFDRARSAHKARMTWQESAPWIEDAVNGAAPDKFVQKWVINGDTRDLAKMRAEIGDNAAMLEAVKKQMVDYIRKRGGADADHTTFTSKGLEDGFKALGEQRLGVFFTPAEIQQMKSAISVARHIQAQPIGSAVNNSNTGALLTAKVANMLTNASGMPVLGPMVAAPLGGLVTRAQVSQMQRLPRGLLADPQIDYGNPLLPAVMGTGLFLGSR